MFYLVVSRMQSIPSSVVTPTSALHLAILFSNTTVVMRRALISNPVPKIVKNAIWKKSAGGRPNHLPVVIKMNDYGV